ncbi:MAG: hypothetical protein NTU98_04910, partial [Bacteroidetes bacterium]|nr:hypothetical protein [Bacteroidota bacterium]
MKRIFYLFFPLFLSVVSVRGQGYTEFWFVAPEVYLGHGDRPIIMRISTTTQTANITLRQPARPLFTPITSPIPPNTTLSIDLTTWIDSIENKPANKVNNFGLYLTSDVQVNAYYEEANASNPEIFTLKGKNALGTEFYINGQYHYKNHWVTTNTAETFDIVATEDNTQVTITVTQDITGHTANSTFTITLNKGQTYSARATNNAANISLAGSHVTANHPIAITVGDDSIDEPETGGASGWDMIGDQIIPVNLLGKEYIAVMGFGNSNDERVYMEAVQNGTSIYLDGSVTPSATINTGQNYWSHFTNNTLYIKSSNPIMAYHLSGFTNEAGSAILPQDSCTGSRQIGFYRTGAGTFAIMLLTRNGNEGSFILDGSGALITAADFNPVTGTSGNWLYARKSFTTAQVPVGSHIITNTSGKFHMGILNALGGSAEYGFYSDFSNLYLGADANLCPNDSTMLDAGPNMSAYAWYKLISGIWTQVGSQQTFWVSDSGYYACVTNGDYCTLSDTIHYSLYPPVVMNLGPDTTVCEGALITLDPGPFVSYRWQNNSMARYFPTNTAGLYWCEVTDNNGCKARDTIIIAIDSLPKVAGSISGLSTVCQGQNGVTYGVPAFPLATTYEWTLPPGASGTSTTNSITLDFSVSAVSDTLRVRGHNLCGYGPELKLPITVDPLPVAAGVISGPASVCPGQSGIIYSVPPINFATTYVWSVPAGMNIVSGAGTNTITINSSFIAVAGNISVHGNNSCGNGPSSSFSVSIYPSPVPAVTGPASVCLNSTTTYTTAAGMTGYTWTVSAGGTITSGAGTNTVNINWSSNGVKTITLNYTNGNGCTAATPSTYNITVNTLPVPNLNGSTSICIGFSATYTSDAGMNNYAWSVSAGGTITSGGGSSDASVTVLWNTVGAQTVSVNYVVGTGCTAANPTVLNVTVHSLPVPAISGTSVLCAGTAGNVYSTQPGMTNYQWTVSAGGTITAGGGAANSSVTVTWNTPGAKTVSVNFNDPDGCTALSPVIYPVTVNPLPVPSLVGPAAVCLNSSGTYTTDAGMSAYTWSVSAGG